MITSIAFGIWTYWHRSIRVISASQPLFLEMICLGTFVMASAIIPLSMDDEYISSRGADIACMAVPWLASVGFVTSFSALFSKLWRVNRIMNHPGSFTRVKLEAKDVMLPFVGLMSTTLVVLICWTILAPLRFERHDDSGTDNFNRTVSSTGSCVSSNNVNGGAAPYLTILACIDVIVLIFANYQAYQIRKVDTDYSESRYIALAMASMLEIYIVGIPISFLVQENRQAYFFVIVLIIFVTSIAITLLMFIPKTFYLQKFKIEMLQKAEQQRERSIRRSEFFRRAASVERLDAAINQGSSSTFAMGVYFPKTDHMNALGNIGDENDRETVGVVESQEFQTPSVKFAGVNLSGAMIREESPEDIIEA